MTLEELTHLFRFQTTKTDDYEPTGRLDYVLINGQNRVSGTTDSDKLETVLESLKAGGYVFDAYRDRTPVFIVPEIIQPL
jgi:hypothetical protein